VSNYNIEEKKHDASSGAIEIVAEELLIHPYTQTGALFNGWQIE